MATEPLAYPDPGGEFSDTPLEELPVIAFDAETGGLDPLRCPLLTVGLAGPHGPVGEWAVLAEGYVPDAKVLEVNRITGDRAAWGSPWLLVERLLDQQLDGRVLLAHNAGYLSFLAAQSCSGAALPPAICTAACCRFLWPGEAASLGDLRKRCAFGEDERPDPLAHTAAADAWACMRGWNLRLRGALRERGIGTWRELCAARAPIPPRFQRPPWPEQVAETARLALEQSRREGWTA